MNSDAERPHHAAARGSRIDRRETARRLLQVEIDKLPADERAIVERFINGGQVSRNVVRELHQARTLGERVADKVAAVGGSWRFIIAFGAFLVVWLAINSLMLVKAFDPYPYILLNLCLSCLAAIQAPVIMMSQNRQAAVDRMRAENDYQVNVKSELEILQVHEKLNQLREQDWATLVELQNRQIEMLQRLLERAASAPKQN
jgi:uncharacterized membrane protein